MKSKFTVIYKLFTLAVLAGIFLSVSGTAPSGRTGAPGEGSCSDCHFGGTQTGSINIEGINDNPVISNKTYNVTVRISLASGISSRAGFSFVALDGNAMTSPGAGTFSNLGTRVGTSTSGTRTYVGHSGGENTYSGSDVTYTFDWTAPASSTNDLSFYAIGNIANGSGTSGDLIVFDSQVNIPLPVDLVSFQAQAANENTAELIWSTASERNSDHFEILRSEDGLNFETIGRVAAAGFSEEMIKYSFEDDEAILNKNSFYRLKQVDIDGQFAYSSIEVIQVMNFDKYHLNIFPNPATNNDCLFIDYFSDANQPDAFIHVYDIYGRVVFDNPQLSAGFQKGFNKIVLETKDLPVGQYFLSINNNGNIIKNKSFIISK